MPSPSLSLSLQASRHQYVAQLAIVFVVLLIASQLQAIQWYWLFLAFFLLVWHVVKASLVYFSGHQTLQLLYLDERGLGCKNEYADCVDSVYSVFFTPWFCCLNFSVWRWQLIWFDQIGTNQKWQLYKLIAQWQQMPRKDH